MTSNIVKAKKSLVRNMPNRKEERIVRPFNLFENFEQLKSKRILVKKVIKKPPKAESEPGHRRKRNDSHELSAPNSKNALLRNNFGIVRKKYARRRKTSVVLSGYALHSLKRKTKNPVNSNITSNDGRAESKKLPSVEEDGKTDTSLPKRKVLMAKLPFSSNDGGAESKKLPSVEEDGKTDTSLPKRKVLMAKLPFSSNDDGAESKKLPSVEEDGKTDTSLPKISLISLISGDDGCSFISPVPGELSIYKPPESGEYTTLTTVDVFSSNTSYEVTSPFGLTIENSLSVNESKRELKCSLLYDKTGNLPLHKAVILGKLSDVIQQCHVLVGGGISLNLKNYDDQTALHLAVQYDESMITEQLLKFNADPAEKDSEGNTALHLSIRKVIDDNKPHECFKLLIKSIHLPKMINNINYQGFSPLHLAALSGAYEEAASIIQAGADIDLKDRSSGRTALFHAVEQRNVEIIDLLMDFDADENTKNMSGQTPISAMAKLYNVRPNFRRLTKDRRRRRNKEY